MDDVFNLIINCIVRIVLEMKDFEITAYGYTTTLWDVNLGLAFTGLVLTLVFALRSVGIKSRSPSERLIEKEDE